MDILSHGLWGAAAVGRKSKRTFLLAFFFGVAPDLFSFGIFTMSTILGLASGPDWSSGPPDPASIPNYVHSLYNITHSLFTFAVVFSIVWFIRKKPFLPLLAWAIHILLDVPTHSTEFFPTPFVWPLSSYRFDGVSWSHPAIFYTNLSLLLIVYLYIYYRKKIKT